MSAASHSQYRKPGAVSVLFGPQGELTPTALLGTRATLLENQDLQYLLRLIAELPGLWPSIVDAYPELKTVSADDKLKSLSLFFNGGPLVDISLPVNNVLLCPLTLIVQIVEFWKLTHEAEHLSDFGSQLQDVQGFCTGLLAAVAVSCSKNELQFQELASKAVRLALCLGAIVDLDSLTMHDCALTIAVRWKSAEHLQHLEGTMNRYPKTYVSVISDSRTATITVPECDAVLFRSQLSEKSIPAMLLTPRGRWHHPDHSHGLQTILTLCQRDKRFRLPDTGVLNSRLLSNMDGRPFGKGSLHEVALKSVLTAQARWDLVFDTLSGMSLHHISIGEKVAIPSISNGPPCAKILEPFLHSVSGKHTTTENLDRESDTEYLKSFPEDAVAVIGMACRYPEADDVEQLWELLSDGKCVTGALPEDRFKLSDLRREPKGPFWGGFVRNIAAFDNRFFGISGREAQSMDPQQRLCLQVAYEAMESAGCYGLRSDAFDHDVGCYIGCANDDYFDNVASHPASAFSLTGTLRSFISGRVSHHLGWTGPSMVLDTACSASAVAIHTACKAIKTKECSAAVAGGVCSMSSSRMTQHLIAARFLSLTGASRAFDADADGYCRAEGAGIVVLRLLKDAMQYGDHILGVICGTAINQGSNETAIVVPDGRSQDLLYQKVLANSGTSPTEITYVEAHGTGTQVGDPTEFESIRKIFGGAGRKDEVFVGSLKDNIGHTEASSGTASLIKTILMFQKDMIPKQANFKRLNPKIRPLGEDRVLIPTRSMAWKAAKRTVMINNYGSCGSNAAIILKDPIDFSPTSNRDVPAEMSHYPVFISGKTVEAVRSFGDYFKSVLLKDAQNTLSSIAYNLALKQNRNFQFCLVLTSSNVQNLLSQLEKATSGTVQIAKVPKNRPPVVLCFGGQDGKMARISKDLYDSSTLLQHHISDCDRVCTSELSLPSLLPAIFDFEQINDTVHLHCALFAIQYACAKCWLDSGLKVDRLLGHSFGQLTTLCVSGSLSLFDAIRLVSERARLLEQYCSSNSGLMLAFEGSKANLDHCLDLAGKDYEHFSAEVACYNGPNSFVIAGDEGSVTAIEKASRVMSDSIWTKRLANNYAFHSRLLDGIIPSLLQVAKELQISTPSIPIQTCSSESWREITPEKIARHTREPVRFADAVERIEQEFNCPIVWLEAGSGSSIIPMLKKTARSSSEHVYITTALRNTDAQTNLVRATCHLWSNGIKVQFWPFHRSQSACYKWINLPPYQFAKTKHWLEYRPNPTWESTVDTPREDQRQDLVYLVSGQDILSEYLFEINTSHDMYQTATKGYEIVGQPVCPTSLYVEFVLMASRLLRCYETLFVPQISGLAFISPLSLKHAGRVLLRLEKHKTIAKSYMFTLFTQNELDKTAGPITHATGCINALQSDTPSTTVGNFQSLSSLMLKRCYEIEKSSESTGFKGPTVYRAMRPILRFPECYHGIQSIYSMDDEAMARIALPTRRVAGIGTEFCDTVLIDSFTQVSDILANCFARGDDEHEPWERRSVGEMTFTQRFVETARKKMGWIAYSKYEKITADELQSNTFIFEPESSRLVLAIMTASFRRLSTNSLAETIAERTRPISTRSRNESANVTIGRLESDAAVNNALSNVTPPHIIQDMGSDQDVEVNADTQSHETPPMSTLMPIDTVAQSSPATESSPNILLQVRQMLSGIIEVPIEEIKPNSKFESLGADSLFMTEIFMEVKQRFDTPLMHSDLANITDVQSLARRISGSGVSSPISTRSSAADTMLSSTSLLSTQSHSSETPVDIETFVYGKRDGTPLSADVYYPSEYDLTRDSLAIALVIHGGGHTMSTRKDIRHDQIQTLLQSGFIAVSVDYRLCPEVTLKKGPMRDVCDALHWVRNMLPQLMTARHPDIRIDGQKVVAVGWSSGGQLAMSLGWTARSLGIAPPQAILAFYCPTDYEDEFWRKPNFPYSQKPIVLPGNGYNHLYDGLHDEPLVGYTPAASLQALGGWMSPDDPRSRIVLHMHWEGQHLPILLGGLRRTGDPTLSLVTTPPSDPPLEEIHAVSPLAHIRAGDYRTPTFLVHGTCDDLVPWQQSRRTHRALVQRGVHAELALVPDAPHLFDMLRGFNRRDGKGRKAVGDGYAFLRRFV